VSLKNSKVVACFEILSWHLLEGLRKITERLSIVVFGPKTKAGTSRTQIRKLHLQLTSFAGLLWIRTSLPVNDINAERFNRPSGYVSVAGLPYSSS
jgi:hypothetical protein